MNSAASRHAGTCEVANNSGHAGQQLCVSACSTWRLGDSAGAASAGTLRVEPFAGERMPVLLMLHVTRTSSEDSVQAIGVLLSLVRWESVSDRYADLAVV